MMNSPHRKAHYRQIAVATTLLVALYILGCATTQGTANGGFTPDTASGISNLLTTAGTLGPIVAPSPWGQIIQTVSFLLLALLTAWQTWTHKAVLEIKSVVTPAKKGPTE